MNNITSKKSATDSALEKTVDFSESTGPVIRNLKAVGSVVISTAVIAFGLGFGASSALQERKLTQGDSDPMGRIDAGYSDQLACDERADLARREYGELLTPLTEEWQRLVHDLDDPLLTSSERKRKETFRKELSNRIDTAREDHFEIVSEMMRRCED